jgi:hypothetical protein
MAGLARRGGGPPAHQVEELLELAELVQRQVRVILQALPQLLFLIRHSSLKLTNYFQRH